MVNRQISLDQGIHLVTRSLEALIAWEGVWGRVERAGVISLTSGLIF